MGNRERGIGGTGTLECSERRQRTPSPQLYALSRRASLAHALDTVPGITCRCTVKKMITRCAQETFWVTYVNMCMYEV